MKTFYVTFWNVQNLFTPGSVIRGPQTQNELDRKIDTLAKVLNRIGTNGPDLIGLAEIESDALFKKLYNQLTETYLHHWEPCTRTDNTGLGILAKDTRFAKLAKVDSESPTTFSRPRTVVVECELLGQSEPFLVAVSHWRSRMKFGSDDAADRKDSARWLGDLLSTTHLSCAVVMGDFNAEPYESPFNQTGLRAVRFFSTALWSQATPAYLYNTAWRFLPEPDYWESASQPGYRVPRPRGTFDSSPPVIFDQIMVSGRALRNGPITLVEDSVYYYTDLPAATQTNLKPQRWDSNSFVGASDHLPLVAKFTIS